MANPTKQDLENVIGFAPTEEQLDAITAPLEPGMIVAGAGTGKTTVMAGRIAWLIMTEQVLPDRILGLTFTTKAAHELLTRVRSFLPKAISYLAESKDQSDVGEPVISTYNAFGSKLLKEHALRLGLEPDARVVVDATRYQLAMRVVCETDYDLAGLEYSTTTAVSELLKLDEQCSNYLVEPAEVITSDRKRISELQAISKPQALVTEMITASQKRIALAHLLEEFRAAKLRYDVIDYSDQIRLAAKAAQSSEQMRNMLKDQYQVVLLDEYQDTSLSQKVLLRELFGDGHPVMAVGDPCQAIYGWRGAEITNMENFKTDFMRNSPSGPIPAEVFKLTANRRSGVAILGAANLLSDELRNLHPEIVELVSGRDDLPAGEIQAALLATFADEVNWVADQVAALKPKQGWGDVALLLREKKNAGDYVTALESRGIPVQVVDPEALVNLPEVREVISYLEVINDPTSNTALTRILMSPRWLIGSRDLAILGRHADDLVRISDEADLSIDVELDHIVGSVDRSERVSLLDALELAAASDKYSYSQDARTRMKSLALELRNLRKYSNESAIDLISRIIRVSGIGIESMIQDSAAGITHFDRLAALIDVAGNFRSLDGDSSVGSFLNYLRDGERFDQLVNADVAIRDDAVVIMSVHKSKGLEFPIVVIPDLTSGVFPSAPKDRHWPKNAFKLPPDVFKTSIQDRLPVFPGTAGPRGVDFKAYTTAAGNLATIDEKRLAYVAVTRAQQHVIASGSWWGPTQTRPRGPSEFLTAIYAQATIAGPWELEPEAEAVNPALTVQVFPTWPPQVNQSMREVRLAAADAVRRAMQSDAVTKSNIDGKLSPTEVELATGWDEDIAALISQAEINSADSRTVKLPNSLSASQIIALQSDENNFLKSLVRPMPRKPSASADRGTSFHAWVETFYGQRALFDSENLPGAIDDDIYSDKYLEQLKEAFKSGPFFERTPYALEMPFALVLAGRTWRGRLDALFTGSLTDSFEPDRWLVVDWKTGKPGSANELQLSIYRQAAALALNVDPDLVEAVFYHVQEKHVHVPEKLLSLAQLEELI
jgi:DNA helicase-2/ATP-dependent DNA helicase PcrA